ENRGEHRLPPPGQPLRHLRTPLLVHAERRAQVVLQIPAQVLQRLGVQRPHHLDRLTHPVRQLPPPPHRHPRPPVRVDVDQHPVGHTHPRRPPPRADGPYARRAPSRAGSRYPTGTRSSPPTRPGASPSSAEAVPTGHLEVYRSLYSLGARTSVGC